MKRNQKGFTLIELLAVIVILAIIALIAVPVIMNILDKANKSAFKDTAYGIISAGELYYAEQQLQLNGMGEDKTFSLPADVNTEDGLQIKGEVPEGTLKVNTKGEIALAVKNARYCITKRYEDTDIKVTDDVENCYFPYTLSAVATTSTELGVTSVNTCATSGTCNPGTEFAIKVNDTDTYKFYVLSDIEENGVHTVTLIMASNMMEDGNYISVAWMSKSHYGDNNFWLNPNKNNKGPITALMKLKETTENWINIDKYSYELDYSTGEYSGEYVQDVRARMLTVAEAVEIGECAEKADHWECSKEWLYTNMSSALRTQNYWLASGSDKETSKAYRMTRAGNIYSWEVYNEDQIGIRPVITISK